MLKSHADAWAEVSAKYGRAQKHINDLKLCLEDLRKSNPYAIGRRDDPNSGLATYYSASVPDIPSDIPLILGDALQNLRSTLDHLIWKMVERDGGTPGTHTGFPIFDDLKEYETRMPGKVKGLREGAIEKINLLYPYKAGNHNLWLLHRLNIVDKHRLLLTVCHRPLGHTLTPSEESEFIRKRGGNLGDALKYEVSYLKGRAVPLHAGDDLRTIPLSEVNENIGFMFSVAISEAGLAEGAPLDMLLTFLSMEVSQVINDLANYV
jgi:hypothetical protein